MIHKNRQRGTKLSEIRDDHVERYSVAVRYGKTEGVQTVCDLGAGYGYGSWILASAFNSVVGYDIDPEVIPFATQHWSAPNLDRFTLDLAQDYPVPADMFTMFEVIEHFHSHAFLAAATGLCRVLVGSVPNELTVPFKGPKVHPEHVRHYTPEQLRKVLHEAGWQVTNIGTQPGKHKQQAKVRWDDYSGRTIVFTAKKPE